MTDFALTHTATWTAGQFPKTEGATHTVTHDQRTHAYNIDTDDYAEFIEWVAMTWSEDETEEGETTSEYLDRIDVDVREV